jgi:predicted transcriptional regulator
MAHQLWISPKTDIRRKGTTFKDLQTLSINQITIKHIYEPLYSARVTDNALDVKVDLERRDFDIVGVIDESERVVGFVKKIGLTEGIVKDFINPIDLSLLVTDSAPLSKLIPLLAERHFAFVMHANTVNGIVTVADINKPIVRIYLFGMISLFEMHLNFWINQNHKDGSWEKVIKEIRLCKAKNTFKLRQGQNHALSLLECLQFCDKRDILIETPDFLSEFNFSKEDFFQLLGNVETIRNELAHSQNTIIGNLDWPDFVATITFLEKSLFESEQKVEENVSNK